MQVPEVPEVSGRQGRLAGTPPREDLNAAILDAVSEPIVTIGRDQRVVATNAAADTLFGWERGDAEGRELVELIVPPECRARERERLVGVCDDADERGERGIRLVALRGDGRRVTLAGAVRPLGGTEDRYACFLRRSTPGAAGAPARDPLTGLVSREALEQQLDAALARARRRGSPLALIHLDLEGFRLVNESLGYDAANELLCCVAERLLRVARTSDVVARHSADEFLVLLPDLGDADSVGADSSARLATVAEAVALRTQAALARPFSIRGTELFVRARAGASIFPLDAGDREELLQHAATAHFEAKAPGSAPTRIFAARSDALARRFETISRLRRGLERGEFVLHYQPIIDLAAVREAAGGERPPMVGVEALIRWEDPERGTIPPLDFIPLAEETGLIEPLGAWVVEEASRQAARWQEQGLTLDVAFNVSLRQLWQPGFAERTLAAARSAGADPHRLIIEITESTVMADPVRTRHVLATLGGHGYRIAIDDFGTGHSSLTRLWRMPVDVLKIDRAFVAEMPADQAASTMATTIIHLAGSLGIEHVAEGIERADQLDFLVEQGAGLGQGFLFGRPMPAHEIAQLAA